MRLQDEFANGIDRMNKIAYSIVNGNAKAWASKAERKGIISISEKIEIENLVGLRNVIGHGGAGRVMITQSDIDSINTFIRIMANTSDRFRGKGDRDMPPGAFRSYIKEFYLNGNNDRQHYFKFEIVYEYQKRSYDDGTRFEGKGYTIYVLDAPYRSWCLGHNAEYEFHFYGIPMGSESICWNTLLTSFQDANKVMLVWAKRYIKILDRLLDDKRITINAYDANQRTRFNLPSGTFRDRTMKMTREVFNKVQLSIGNMKPEQGGILGIRGDGDIIDCFVHDKSAKVGYAEYSPDVAFLNNVINRDWNENGIDFCGFIHSHPGQSSELSKADIEYAKRIMEAFDLAYLYMPLVNSSADGKFKMHGYIVFLNGRVEKMGISIINKRERGFSLSDKKESSLSEDEIMRVFETSKAKPIKEEENTQYERIASCLPLEHLGNSVVIGIGCGGAREFYLDLARTGVKNFVLMDGDDVAISNISTQNDYLPEIGTKKVQVISDKIKQIDPTIKVETYPIMLDDSLDDSWIEEHLIKIFDGKNIIICGFTDSFFAQARIANIAVKYNIPFISAQHHQHGETSEIVYWYPGVSRATPKSILKQRYKAYENGYKNTVTSDGSPIFNTVRLNALCEKIAIGMILYSHNKYNMYSHFLLNKPNCNLILIRQNTLLGSTSSFVNSFAGNADSLFDDPIWIEVEDEPGFKVSDTRKIFSGFFAEKNVVIETLETMAGTDKVEFISGEILNVSTKKCRLSHGRGSLYGIAIKLTDEEDKQLIFNSVDEKSRRIKNIDDWKTIGNGFYPLYWGKDINMGMRLHSHTKTMPSTGTLQLDAVSPAFKGHEIIYGALPCVNYEAQEKKLHSEYIDLMKTKKSRQDDKKVGH